MLLSPTAFAIQIRADVSSRRVLLLTLFFGSAGMVADPLWILWHIHLVAAATVALTIGKLAIIAALFMAFRQSQRVPTATGLALAQIGEFAFVLGAIGRTSGVVSDDVYALVVSVTIVSFFVSAFAVPIALAPVSHSVDNCWTSPRTTPIRQFCRSGIPIRPCDTAFQ